MKKILALGLLVTLVISLGALALEDKFAHDGTLGGEGALSTSLDGLSEFIDEAIEELECDECEDGESRIVEYQYPDPDPDGEDDDESCLFPPPPGSRDGSGEDPLDQETKDTLSSDDCSLCESKSSCECDNGICKRRVKVCIRKPSRNIWAL